MLSVKQGVDSTWDWTSVSRAIGKHSNSKEQLIRAFNRFRPCIEAVIDASDGFIE